MSGKVLALIHTVKAYDRLGIGPLLDSWLEQNADVEVFNIADDSLLSESVAHDGPTPAVIKRLQLYFLAAEAMGADAAVCTCTTVGEATRIARQYLSIPVLNIDEPMAREAVTAGRTLGIVATVPTSPAATQRVLDRAAADAGVAISTRVSIVPDAFDHVQRGDVERHDELVCREIERVAREVDVVVLGQISLSRVRCDAKAPVLQVGESGLAEARRLLDSKAARSS